MKTSRTNALHLLAPVLLLGFVPVAGARSSVGISVNLGGLAWSLVSGCHGTRVAVAVPPVLFAPAPVACRPPVVFAPPVVLPRPPAVFAPPLVLPAPPVVFGPRRAPPPRLHYNPHAHHRMHPHRRPPRGPAFRTPSPRRGRR